MIAALTVRWSAGPLAGRKQREKGLGEWAIKRVKNLITLVD